MIPPPPGSAASPLAVGLRVAARLAERLFVRFIVEPTLGERNDVVADGSHASHTDLGTQPAERLAREQPGASSLQLAPAHPRRGSLGPRAVPSARRRGHVHRAAHTPARAARSRRGVGHAAPPYCSPSIVRTGIPGTGRYPSPSFVKMPALTRSAIARPMFAVLASGPVRLRAVRICPHERAPPVNT